MYQLENLVQEQLPELHLHFQSQVGVNFICSIAFNNRESLAGLSNVNVRFKLVPDTLYHCSQPQPHLLSHHGRLS